MNEETIKAAVVEGIREGLDHVVHAGVSDDEAKRKAFYVPPEQHYKHHQFIDSFVQFVDEGRTTVFRTVVRAMVGMFIFAMVVGFLVIVKYKTIATWLGGV